jgi:hypothetical protein
MNWNVEPGCDHVLLEARTAGGEDWTTLPDKNGNTSQTVPEECGAGYFMRLHPFLGHYLTRSGATCTAGGSSGAWNSFTGASDGWKPVAFDLAAYAGKKVEVSLSNVTDPSFGLRGAVVDNAQVVVSGAATETEGFESSLGVWTASAPPAGSPNITGDWARTGELYKPYAAVTTRDTVLVGFGLEHIPAQSTRNALIGKALAALRR